MCRMWVGEAVDEERVEQSWSVIVWPFDDCQFAGRGVRNPRIRRYSLVVMNCNWPG